MRPDGIVMPAPALDDDLRLAKSVEDLAVEQLVPEPGIEEAEPSLKSAAKMFYVCSYVRRTVTGECVSGLRSAAS
jgi:hypothetical protein